MLSLVTTCKNRFQFLSKSMKSYIDQPLISEVIIVDFDSDNSVHEELKAIASMEKVKVLRVDDQPIWKIGLAQNIGLSFVKNDIFLKIDSDVGILNIDKYFESVKAGDFSYIRGMHSKGTSSGLIMAKKELWQKVGGYNDWLMGWGYDDSDFYERITELCGNKLNYFSEEDFSEIKQVMSVKNNNAKKLLTGFDFEDIDFAFDHRFTLSRNYILTKILPQNFYDRLTYKYKKISDSLYDVEIEDFENKLKNAFPKIELANIIALSLYKSGKSIQDVKTRTHLDYILDNSVGL